MIRPESIGHAMRVIYQMEGDIEDLEDKLHECLCGDLETALGKIQKLEEDHKYAMKLAYEDRVDLQTKIDALKVMLDTNEAMT